jgi:hypothetical protein
MILGAVLGGVGAMAKTGIESKGKFSDPKYRAKLGESFVSGAAIGALSSIGGNAVGTYLGSKTFSYGLKTVNIPEEMQVFSEHFTSTYLEGRFETLYKKLRKG